MGDLLHGAAARGDSHLVVRLLEEGAKPYPDEGGRNALHIAATAGHADIVAALLLARWDPNASDKQGCGPLQRGAAAGHLEIVKLLIQHGANVNAQDKAHGNTALHEASWRGFSKCVEALSRAKRANLDLKNLGGFTALHLACQNGHNQSCRELLLAGANPDIQNNYGDTPLHTSARYGHAGVTRILISAECRVSEQNKNGDTPVHITAAMGRRKLTRILLEAGCDPSRRNKQGERAKDIAIRKDLNEILEIMEKTVAARRKREKGSGSSKDSSGRKEKKKSRHGKPAGPSTETWSPYGCHYFPDPQTFPQPKLDSLPPEPLRTGEQYFLDLAGNIRKGPVGVGYTCYCAPFFRHMEARLERDKRELKAHIDAAQGRLDKKVTSLEVATRSQLEALARGAALERAKCRQRHLHLEQWLLRGSVLRPAPRLSRARSLDSVLEPSPKQQQRSSSREGKESGKGSSELVGPISESEDGSREEGVRRTTRAMSERIDQVLKTGDGPETMERLYSDLLEWRKHNRERRHRSDHAPRESVKDIVAKFQKHQTVQELISRIQKKTDKIHKSAQKLKDLKARLEETESSDEDEAGNCVPRTFEAEEAAISRLPYRCRDTVYSPDLPVPRCDSYGALELHHRGHSVPVHFSSAHDLLRGHSPCRPTENSSHPDSGYSTKPWGSTPSPPAPDVPLPLTRHRVSKPPVPVRKTIHSATASLV